MGMRTHPGGKSRPLTATTLATVPLLAGFAFLLLQTAFCNNTEATTVPQDAVHITAILGESVVFNCHVDFPDDQPVPYVLQWEKKVGDTVPLNTSRTKRVVPTTGQEIPIYIWYESYPTHSADGYQGRVSKVSPDSPYGAASLNLTNIQESDQGWYECKVVFLNRSPNPTKNGTWFHLSVHAPPRFVVTADDIIYVNLGDAIILNCQAEGNPIPEIVWYKDANPVEPSPTIGIFNDGTELRLSNIRHEDIGDYTCIARNGEGQISHTSRVIIAGGAVIMVPPINQTKLEGEKVQFNCEAKALPGNVTVKWFREGAPVREVASLETRVTIRRDGSLVINPVSADDSGQYVCEVSNGIGEPQSASAYLNVEFWGVATIVTATQLVVEGTQPHAPYNISASASEFSVTLSWLPGYSGGPDYKQDYTIWYRESGVTEWSTIPVTPSGSTQVTINRLAPGTTYEFQVIGKNALGEGMMSNVVTIRTLDVGLPAAKGVATTPPIPPPSESAKYLSLAGPKPGPPRNLTVTEISNGFLITWQPPLEGTKLVQYYNIKYRTEKEWKSLNKGPIRAEDTQYLVKNLVGGRTYYFKVLAHSPNGFESSEDVKFPVPARVKHKAITAGVVGGILFFIVAIILSICAVKICNKRKRRKQEKAYNMVACRITDARNGATDSQVPLKKTVESDSYRDYESVFIIPGTSVDTNRGKKVKSCAAVEPTSSVRTLTYLEKAEYHLAVLAFIVNWVWPRDRCRSGSSLSWHPDYFNPGSPSKSLAKISRAADGRFHLADSSYSSRAGTPSNGSSSDDGGFLTRRGVRNRASWRRPLVGYPSELSLRTDASGQSARVTLPNVPGPAIGAHYLYPVRPVPTIYSPTTPLFQSSSPADSNALLLSPWSPMYFSDLSSVRYPSSGERSYPTPPGFMQLRSIHEKYSQELPSLRAIHEESTFIPVHPIHPSPVSRVRLPPHYPVLQNVRPRARLLPRHARIARSAPELGSPDHPDRSPESRSSSSGFGSKNTSQQNQSSQSGSTFTDWRLPPYRPPPPPSSSALPPPPPSVGHWLEMASSSPSTSEQTHKAVDVGSVDGHYEFDPSTPTPTPSTPTERRDTDLDAVGLRKSYNTLRSNRYDNIEARVRAMKEEFHEFRKRQAKRKRSQELESVC
ncbi:LOW QUALITY PROTEIN: protein turtle [Agrilus planipennis]|uniref:LOW QUALITY PROTEIN: protein turtle n=1 Tax=Agrilus planipennis TaxID=224129 RepID=A0A7F5R6E3_AGRPL|nr:LOW QUALITY PROTEIN: protein turtle [Agrilus planipennis]